MFIPSFIKIYRLVWELTGMEKWQGAWWYYECALWNKRNGLIIKAKAVPLYAMKVLGGERRYSSYSFSTLALDGGEWSASCPDRALPQGKTPVPIVQEAGWAPELVWTQVRGKILCRGWGLNPDRPVVQPVVRHYTAWANPAPGLIISLFKYIL
jgi:hypothetical protein